jgi:hypothetical protein
MPLPKTTQIGCNKIGNNVAGQHRTLTKISYA